MVYLFDVSHGHTCDEKAWKLDHIKYVRLTFFVGIQKTYPCELDLGCLLRRHRRQFCSALDPAGLERIRFAAGSSIILL